MLLVKGDEAAPKRGERQLISTAINKVIMSVVECLPLLKTMPLGGDRVHMEATCEQSHAPHLKVAPSHCISSLLPLSLKTVAPKQFFVVSNNAAKSMREAHVPSAQTVPTLTKPLPACPVQAISTSPLAQDGHRRERVSINGKSGMSLPVPQEAVPQQPPLIEGECLNKHSRPMQKPFAQAPRPESLDEAAAVYDTVASCKDSSNVLQNVPCTPVPFTLSQPEPVVSSQANTPPTHLLNDIRPLPFEKEAIQHDRDTIHEHIHECPSLSNLSSHAWSKTVIGQKPSFLDAIMALT